MKEVKLELPNGKDYLSYSSAKHLAKHPKAYLDYISGERKESDEIDFGIYYENVVFGQSNDDFLIYDEKEIIERAFEKYGKDTKSIKSTNAYKDIIAEIENEAIETGKKLMSKGKHDSASVMNNILEGSGVKGGYLRGDFQVVKEKEIDTGEYLVKGLIKSDVINNNSGVIVINDLKSTDIEQGRLVAHAKQMDYDLQAYLSYEVGDADDFNFVFQRTKNMYEVTVINVEREGWFWESGKEKFNRAIKNYLEYISPESKTIGVNPMHYYFYKSI